MKKVCVVGASGFTGGELLRILLQHSGVEVVCATSRKFKGEYVYRVHPTSGASPSLGLWSPP